ncbi:ATP-dependent RecD-like DNA helicase [Tolypothrix bouteillei VB521301_2]|uniref:ATP-dependent DNA helicase n=1 Tax=Tolypothrix bouteillei TaxID=1246981 RepID=UPI0038B51FB0
MAAYSKVTILTGGPGCGKTFCTRTIVELWKAMGKSIALAAPTGRAAQRLSEMTGLEAKTIHRLLEFDPKTMGFKRDSNNPLPQRAIVIDEASMLDLFLAYSVVQALAEDAQLLLVGDIDQLPSVGPGNVLADLIHSGKVPVVRLTQVFRQAQQSAIITAAHQINRGQYPAMEELSDNPTSDCLWHGGGHEPEHGIQVICELINGFDSPTGLTQLPMFAFCPMTRGIIGTRNLNGVLQQPDNPPPVPTQSRNNERDDTASREIESLPAKPTTTIAKCLTVMFGLLPVLTPKNKKLERDVVYDWQTSTITLRGLFYMSGF